VRHDIFPRSRVYGTSSWVCFDELVDYKSERTAFWVLSLFPRTGPKLFKKLFFHPIFPLLLYHFSVLHTLLRVGFIR